MWQYAFTNISLACCKSLCIPGHQYILNAIKKDLEVEYSSKCYLCIKLVGVISLCSSGTSSGKQKIIPSTKELKALITKRFFLTNAILNRLKFLPIIVWIIYYVENSNATKCLRLFVTSPYPLGQPPFFSINMLLLSSSVNHVCYLSNHVVDLSPCFSPKRNFKQIRSMCMYFLD